MTDDGFLDDDVAHLSERIRSGALSVAGLIDASLARIATRDPHLHAFVKVFDRTSKSQARELDAELARGHWRGPLHGLPVAVKDIADIEGEITGFGSRCYSDRPADRTAQCIASLTEAGAVIIGKTQMVEFAYGSWGTNHGLGTPVNPAVEGHACPGGSSSGSAVAVAGGLVPLAIGSDTGGSVRIPAALCGVAGMKPSRSLIPLDGIAPLSPALDVIGPMARDVSGLRMLLQGLQPNWNGIGAATVPAKVWTLADSDLNPVEPVILQTYRTQIAALNLRGVETHTFSLPRSLAEYQHLCGAIMAFDAYQTLETLVRDYRLPMDPLVRRRIAQGRAILPKDRQEADTVRTRDIAVFRELFGQDDVLFLPATPSPPQQIKEIDESEITMSRFTRIANYLDLCAVTMPLIRPGWAPFGMQLVAQANRDDLLLSAFTTGSIFDNLGA